MRVHWIAGALIAVVLGALLLLTGGVAWYATGDRYQERVGRSIAATDLQLTVGEGLVEDDSLVIGEVSTRGHAVVVTPVMEFPEGLFARLEFSVSGNRPGQRFILLWGDPTEPDSVRTTALDLPDTGEVTVALSEVVSPGEEVVRAGIVMQGGLDGPVAISGLRLLPDRPTVAQLLRRIGSEWTAFEGRRGHSINYIVGGARNALLPPTLAAAIWVVLGAAIYLLMTTLTPMPRRLLPLVVIFMAGWLALDLRWQFEQVRNLAEARDEFAGVPLERRWGASLGPLAGVLDEIRDGLPDGGRILFATLDDDPDVARYMALTARYYLLPHDVMPTWKQQGGMENMITRLAPGDHLLFLKSDGPVRSKAPDSAVPVSRTRHSALYRIER